MRLSIQRLRWVLITGALLLVVVLVGYIGYGRYVALKAYRQILARAGVTLTRDSNGVTYSQSLQGRKIYTIRAKTESSLGNGKYALHDAEMFLYNRTGDHPDHIYGSEIEYDENAGIARARGDVFMDLQPPQGLANGGHTAAAPGAIQLPLANSKSQSAPTIHVRTSGLVYVRKLGVAATDQQVDFSYGDMHCTALGAEFNTGENTLHLLANVRMDGLAHGKPLHVTATRADMDQDANVANLAQPVVTSEGHSLTADGASLHLRKDGSIEHVQANRHVVLIAATRQITADHLDADLNPQSIPQTSRLTGNVILNDTNPLRPMQGSANIVDTVYDAKGSPVSMVATGKAKLSLSDRKSIDPKSNPPGLARSMEGAKIVALFAPAERRAPSRITDIHATGAAHIAGESIATPAKGTVTDATRPLPLKNAQVWADDLNIYFTQAADGKAQPQTLVGLGHTRLQQDAPLAEQETSSGDTLKISFANTAPPTRNASDRVAMNIASATQTGHVTIHDRAATKLGSTAPASVSTGTADRATYDGSTEILTLSGDAHLYGDNASLIAPTATLNQRTQDADASGGVQATFENAASNNPQTAVAAKPAPLTHILSASAHFDHATKLANFYGTDAQPTRMWQDASQVQAAILLFDGIKRTFSARPAKPGTLIHAIFASNPAAPKPGRPTLAAGIIRVASPKMDYNDLQREATFTDGVTIDSDTGSIRGQHAAVFLAPAPKPQTFQPQPSPLNGSIDRVVVYNDVQMDQPGRHGTGDQLLYTVVTGTYVLTGTPTIQPHIVDAQQGNVTGKTLVFSDAGSTIVVSGDPKSPPGKGPRVRTETHVSPAKEERQ
jgi:lipopolysaccharide export system protein LptA